MDFITALLCNYRLRRHSRNSPPPFPFLRLPESIRRQIYIHAGLITGSVVVPRHKIFHIPDSEDGSQDDAVTFALQAVSPAIRREVQEIMCQENHVVAGDGKLFEALVFLSHLRREVYAGISDLTIIMGFYENKHFHDSNTFASDHAYVSCPRLFAQKRKVCEQEITGIWQSTISNMLDNSVPKTLRLRLFCDTEERIKTIGVVQPLLDRPGQLKELELSVGSRRGSSALACDLGAQIMGRVPKPGQSFRFFDLMPELRQQILLECGLRTPDGEIHHRGKGFHVPETREYYRRLPCRSVSLYSTQNSIRMSNGRYAKHLGLACSRSRSGYSTHCICWCLPGTLMRVSSAMLDDVMFVLLANNRVVVKQHPNEAAFTSMFLHGLAPPMFFYLRTLEFNMPDFSFKTSEQKFNQMIRPWIEVTESLKRHANLGSLKLIIRFPIHCGFQHCWRASRTLVSPDVIDADKERWLRMQKRIAESLQLLSGVDRLFIYLDMDYGLRPLPSHGPASECEQWLERIAMGDAYDSNQVGRQDMGLNCLLRERIEREQATFM